MDLECGDFAPHGHDDIDAIRLPFEIILNAGPTDRMSWSGRLLALVIAASVLPVTGTITAQDRVPTAEVSAAERDSAPLQTDLSKETNVEGRVVNGDKKPIADAWISVDGYVGGEANDFEAIYLRSDENGRFKTNVPSRRFRVHVGSPSVEYENAGLKVKDLPATVKHETTIRRRIVLAAYVAIRGKYLPEVAKNEYVEIYRLKLNRMSIGLDVCRSTSTGCPTRVALPGRYRVRPSRFAGG